MSCPSISLSLLLFPSSRRITPFGTSHNLDMKTFNLIRFHVISVLIHIKVSRK